jgi:prepilin-type N-terminal cleavage/methylation domain-containing protein/prepilin-type processing-associated H-X9-DG protein
MPLSPAAIRSRPTGFTLLELLVVVSIILALAVIVLPVFNLVQQRSGKIAAMSMMRQLGAASEIHVAQNDNHLPDEGSVSANSWSYASDPANAKCWFNALPRLLGVKPMGAFAGNPAAFYTKENMLYLPGAIYPAGGTRLIKPLYAVGINSKLQRRNASGSKELVNKNNIPSPSKTVLFLERGLPSEKRAMPTIPSYDGAPKASPNAFVARHSKTGVLTFVDGHAASVETSDILDPSGNVRPASDFIWSL